MCPFCSLGQPKYLPVSWAWGIIQPDCKEHRAARSSRQHPSTVTSQLGFSFPECENNFDMWISMLLWESLAPGFPRASCLLCKEWLWSLQKVSLCHACQSHFLSSLITHCRFLAAVSQLFHGCPTAAWCRLGCWQRSDSSLLFVAFLSNDFPWTSYVF